MARHAEKPQTNRSRRKRTAPGHADASTPAAAPAPAEHELSVNDMRQEVMRKVMLFMSDWRRCPRKACRRAKRCTETGLDCGTPPRRARPMTAEQEAQAMAHFHRALKRRLAELGSAKGSGR